MEIRPICNHKRPSGHCSNPLSKNCGWVCDDSRVCRNYQSYEGGCHYQDDRGANACKHPLLPQYCHYAGQEFNCLHRRPQKEEF